VIYQGTNLATRFIFREKVMKQERVRVLRTRATAPKAAAIAGILFSVLLITSVVLLLNSLFSDRTFNEIQFAADKQNIQIALNLVPFASIAFLWFMGVVRDRFGDQEDQFFGTVFLGSGLLFIAMLFVSSAVAGSFILLFSNDPSSKLTASYYDLSHTVAGEIITTYGIKMAGVFMISTCPLFIRTRVIPRWLALLGYGLAAIMILRIGYIDRLGWIFLSFPLWVFLLSLHILIDNYRKKQEIETT
jgi:hypothetical protein